jgi:hypothetical protein
MGTLLEGDELDGGVGVELEEELVESLNTVKQRVINTIRSKIKLIIISRPQKPNTSILLHWLGSKKESVFFWGVKVIQDKVSPC